MEIKNIFNKKGASEKQKTSEEFNPIKVCKNCGTNFQGNFCPHCGQSIREFNRPFRILIYDFMGTMFAFDTRFFKTLKAIVLSPGRFSSDFVAGKRASHMQPFQFYVFVSFIFFLLLNIKTGQFISNNSDHLDKALAITSIAVDSVKAQLSNEPEIKALGINLGKAKEDTTLDKTEKDKVFAAANIKKLQSALLQEYKNPKSTPFVKRILEHAIQLMNYPEIFVSKALRYYSWSLFILMPIFGFWLWLFFHKARKFYSAHLIYSLSSLSTVFLILSLILAIKLIFPGRMSAPENYLFWLIPIYIWMGLKRFYNRSVFGTTVRFFVLSLIYFVSTFFTALIVFFLSLYF